MAFLHNADEGTKHYLLTHHNIGRRDETVDTCINSHSISRIHAIIEWDAGQWYVRDMSRNGTWLDKQRLPLAQSTALNTGQTLYFASPNHPGWLIKDLSPPNDILIPVNHIGDDIKLTSYHLLPDDEAPELALSFCSYRSQWYMQSINTAEEKTPLPLFHGRQIQCGNKSWELFLPGAQKVTHGLQTTSPTLDDFEFRFELSLDEEYTHLELLHNQETYDLQERTHHCLLAHLARKRAQDAQNGLDECTQGWIYNDQLEKELGLDITHINIQIFRARKQLTQALGDITGLDTLVQRRKGCMRFSYSKMMIYKGNQLQYRLLSQNSTNV